MPIYLYECESCGREFDALIRKKSDLVRLKCPACEHKGLKKIMSSVSFNQNRFDKMWRKTEPERKKLMKTPLGRKVSPKAFGR